MVLFVEYAVPVYEFNSLLFFFFVQTIIDHEKGGISFLWSWSYWSTFVLTWYATYELGAMIGLFTSLEQLCIKSLGPV